jgi:putative ABC transport system ATP-binding protein/lipoprotein-releasing system ATP-binding protein
MIEVKNLTKSYNVDRQVLKAVDDVNVVIHAGEMASIVGHSGSGKTTFLSLIGGLTKPDSGSIVINGVDIWSLDDDRLSEFRNRKMSFIYQFSSLIPTLTVSENVLLPTAFGRYGAEIEKDARELLDRVGLKDKMRAYPSQLSGGQQRRVAIARAFINRPEIVLADEPTGDLDEETEQEIEDLFQRMNAEREITFLIVTHNSDIARRAKRQLTMRNGVLTEKR